MKAVFIINCAYEHTCVMTCFNTFCDVFKDKTPFGIDIQSFCGLKIYIGGRFSVQYFGSGQDTVKISVKTKVPAYRIVKETRIACSYPEFYPAFNAYIKEMFNAFF